MRFKVRYLALSFFGLCLGSCVSPKFEKAWKSSESGGSTQRWVGNWQSARHGARGRLRAVSEAPKEGQCAVFFEAGWHGFTTAYPVVLNAEKKGRLTFVSGQHELKSFVGGGVYTYSGTIAGSVFSTTYSSKYDAGTFTLESVSGR